MNKHRKKHLILECLIAYDNEHFDDVPYFGAMYPDSIKEDSKYYFDDVYGILNSLTQTKDVFKQPETDELHVTLYGVTEKGRNSYFEKIYLNKIWWRSQKFWSIFIPTIISLGALVVSIVALSGSSSCPEKIEVKVIESSVSQP